MFRRSNTFSSSSSSPSSPTPPSHHLPRATTSPDLSSSSKLSLTNLVGNPRDKIRQRHADSEAAKDQAIHAAAQKHAEASRALNNRQHSLPMDKASHQQELQRLASATFAARAEHQRLVADKMGESSKLQKNLKIITQLEEQKRTAELQFQKKIKELNDSIRIARQTVNSYSANLATHAATHVTPPAHVMHSTPSTPSTSSNSHLGPVPPNFNRMKEYYRFG